MKKLLIAVTVALSVVGISGASASIPAPNGTINGCYATNPPARLLVIRDSTETCPTGTTSIDWNQTGPPGPVGPPGPAGPPGSPGPAGFANSVTDESTTLTISLVAGAWRTVSTVNLTLPAEHRVLLIATMEIDSNCCPDSGAVRFLIDGTPVVNGSPPWNQDNLFRSATNVPTMTWVVTLGAGAHTISTQAEGSGNNPDYVTTRHLTALDLGP